MHKLSSKENKNSIILIAVGIFTQILWVSANNFGWGWDSLGYLAIGRQLLGMQENMWNLKYYYPPGVSILMVITGVYTLNTLLYFKIIVFFMSASMPLMLYKIFYNFHEKAAFISGIVFAAFFGASIYSQEIMSNHAGMFFQLLFLMYIYNIEKYSGFKYSILFGIVLFMFIASRSANFTMVVAIIPYLYKVMSKFDRKILLKQLRDLFTLTIAFFVSIFIYSCIKSINTSEKFKYEISRDMGPRILMMGAYTGGSFYLNGYSNPIFTPSNGMFSKEFFSHLENRFDKMDLSKNNIGNYGQNSKEIIDYLIRFPSLPNYYEMWFGIDAELNLDQADRLVNNVFFETVLAQPRLLKYYMWNSYNFFFGSMMTIKTDNKECFFNCFDSEVPQINPNESKFDGAVFDGYVHTNIINEINDQYKVKINSSLINIINIILIAFYSNKKYLVILTLLSPFLVNEKYKHLAISLVLICLVTNAVTSLCFPPHSRYWYPIMPIIIFGSALVISQFIEKLKMNLIFKIN